MPITLLSFWTIGLNLFLTEKPLSGNADKGLDYQTELVAIGTLIVIFLDNRHQLGKSLENLSCTSEYASDALPGRLLTRRLDH